MLQWPGTRRNAVNKNQATRNISNLDETKSTTMIEEKTKETTYVNQR